jgi:hypothetical protein
MAHIKSGRKRERRGEEKGRSPFPSLLLLPGGNPPVSAALSQMLRGRREQAPRETLVRAFSLSQIVGGCEQ